VLYVYVVDLFLRCMNLNCVLLFVTKTFHYFTYFQFMNVFQLENI